LESDESEDDVNTRFQLLRKMRLGALVAVLSLGSSTVIGSVNSGGSESSPRALASSQAAITAQIANFEQVLKTTGSFSFKNVPGIAAQIATISSNWEHLKGKTGTKPGTVCVEWTTDSVTSANP
jgi:hypothetical protein